MKQPADIVHIVNMDTVGAQTFVKLVRNLSCVIYRNSLFFIVTKNFSTCSDDCSNRRCYLNAQQNPQCCKRECAAGCTGPRDDQCIVSGCHGDYLITNLPIGM